VVVSVGMCHVLDALAVVTFTFGNARSAFVFRADLRTNSSYTALTDWLFRRYRDIAKRRCPSSLNSWASTERISTKFDI
jgi:hypothetical protein